MLGIAQNVVSKVTSAHIEGELNLFPMSDHKILELIYTSHVHEDDSFDVVDSLLLVTENIIKRSTQIIDNFVQGTQGHVGTIDEKPPKASFSSLLCTLKSIGCELSCQGTGEEIAHKSTLSILNKLSTCFWEAKAVLTLAAFALEYGEFWLLAEIHQSDLLANSVAILRRVPVLLKPVDLQKRSMAVGELNTLIKTTLEVIELIFELEKRFAYDSKDVPLLAVYLSIITIVACATKVTLLTRDENKPHGLPQYSKKIRHILKDLESIQLKIKRAEVKLEVFTKIIFFYGGKDNEWIQQFEKKATAIANDPFIKELKINIELCSVPNINKQSNTVTKEVQNKVNKLSLPYKNESGWAVVLSKGSTVVVSGHGFTILNVLQDFERWKELIKEKGLEVSFKTYHEKVMQTMKHCIDIPSVAEKVPKTMKCPVRGVGDLAHRKAM